MKLEQFQWTVTGGWDRPLHSTTLGDSAQLVLLFGRGGLVAAQQCLTLVREAFPEARLFGCSTGGEIHSTQVGDESITVTAVSFEHSRIATALHDIDGVDGSFAAGEGVIRQLDPKGLRHVVVLSEGLTVDSSALVRGINAAIPADVTVSGGFAADGNRFQSTYVWCDSEPRRSAVVALGFYGERLQIGMGVTGGWGPFGPDRIITKSIRNVLYEFDGRPALALYKQYLGDYTEDLTIAGLTFPIELRNASGTGRVLRSLLAVDEEAQSITFAGDVPEGSYARLMIGHIEDLISGTLSAGNMSRDDLGSCCSELSFIVSCNGRRAVLKQRVEEEIEAVREAVGDKTVLTGFYSYGEIAASFDGPNTELHNETMSITNFAEV